MSVDARPRELMVRVLLLTLLATGAVCLASPSNAQTYDPDFPVCLHLYGRTGYIDCRYTSLAQCAQSASGRGAQCETNPYFAQVEPGPAYRRGRHVH
jgi:uncharacterized protein DUF3551